MWVINPLNTGDHIPASHSVAASESVIKEVWQHIKTASSEQRGLFLCAFSLLLPFPLTCAVLLGTILWILLRRKLWKKIWERPGTPVLGVIGLMALVLPVIYKRWIGLAAGIGLAVVLLLFLYAQSVLETAPEGSFGTILDLFCLGSGIPFLIGVTQKLIMGQGYRAAAGMLNANYYGCAIEFLILISVCRLMAHSRHRRFYVAVLSMNVAAIFLCDCQSVWFAVIGGILTLLIVTGKRRQILLFAGASALVVILIVTIPGILPRLNRLPATFETRMDIWRTAFKGIIAHPFFGKGLLTYLDIWKPLGGYQTYHAHSLYLDPLLSLGLVGTVLSLRYCRLRFQIMRRGWRSTAEKALIYSIVASVLIHGITDIPVLWVQTGGMLLLILSAPQVRPVKVPLQFLS